MSPKDLQTELERLARSSREQLEASKQIKQTTPEPDPATAAAPSVASEPDSSTSQAKASPEKKLSTPRASPAKQVTPGSPKSPGPTAKASPKSSPKQQSPAK
ncbi:unnamed protein product [Echinostoma caproni]|uniref:Translation initiation factor IF-2 n=1 Tax=Echinostoma caproni TaxID=27848 RepID=A0A183B9M4_9TREM|nr:unnamed protein product [Echinostoma caproni]